MKKTAKFVAVCAILSAMVVSMAACSGEINISNAPTQSSVGSSVESSVESSAESSVESSVESSDEVSKLVSSKYQFANLQEYLDNDMVQKQLESLKESVKESGMTVEVKVEDESKFVYEYTYLEQQDVSGAEEILLSELENNSSTFNSGVKQFKSIIDDSNISVVVRYFDADGTLICEKEFFGD
ncbi:MAG: DUF4854 domain-containing protein [Acutalibacteraceae bacterium]